MVKGVAKGVVAAVVALLLLVSTTVVGALVVYTKKWDYITDYDPQEVSAQLVKLLLI